MNNRQLKTLLAVNLRLVNPQVTDRLRKKGATGKKLSRKLTRQFYLNALLFLGIYGLSIAVLDLNKMPGMFTFYVALFILLGISQSISGIYNVFFASNDLVDYLPLPFRNQEIFISKLLVVVFNSLPFTTPLLLIFAFTAIRAHIFFLLAILMAILMYVLILGIILALCSLLVFGLTKLKLFQAHQKVVMNLLLGLNMILVVGGLYFMNRGSANNSSTSIDHAVIKPLLPFFNVFTTPTDSISLLTWAGTVVLLLVLLALTWRLALTHLVEQLTQVNNALVSTQTTHRPSHHRNLKQGLRSYQFQLLKEPNLILQLFSNSVLMPLVFVMAFLFSGSTINLSNLSLNWLGVWFVGGLAVAAFTVNQASLVGNLISLDKMNFDFIKAMPIPLAQYLHQKFQLGYWLQVLINVILALIVAIIVHLPFALDIALVLGVTWGTYLFSQHYFVRDYRLRSTDWTNVTQLFNRGSGSTGLVLNMLASALISAVVIIVYSLLIAKLASLALILNILAFAIVGLISGGFLWHYHQSFWQQLS
ncbi:hypothetical protein [Lactiplantibacillus herbarum]|uniref:hypothetical protein n=1 Tax=Lactiplantibacillus herbarum TaxID=1670446 RepID=UPI00064ED2F0|nr:hypothetical protein [Lactiplantibacillus herbarum]